MHNESLQNEWRVWNSAQRQLTPTKSYTPAPPSQVGKNVARNIIWKRYHRFTDDIHFYETSLWGPIDSITLHSCTKRYVAPAWTHLQNALYSDLQKKQSVKIRTVITARKKCFDLWSIHHQQLKTVGWLYSKKNHNVTCANMWKEQEVSYWTYRTH